MKNTKLIPIEIIEKAIFLIRRKKVMLDFDLAKLYGIKTGDLIQAIKRNIKRFPADFMFQLNQEEFVFLRSQIVISKKQGGRRYLPYAFTEQGIAMLSSVLRSERAIEVNIAIMRTFVRLREIISSHKDLREKLEKLEEKYDKQFRIVFEAIKKLIDEPKRKERQIGFRLK